MGAIDRSRANKTKFRQVELRDSVSLIHIIAQNQSFAHSYYNFPLLDPLRLQIKIFEKFNFFLYFFSSFKTPGLN